MLDKDHREALVIDEHLYQLPGRVSGCFDEERLCAVRRFLINSTDRLASPWTIGGGHCEVVHYFSVIHRLRDASVFIEQCISSLQ